MVEIFEEYFSTIVGMVLSVFETVNKNYCKIIDIGLQTNLLAKTKTNFMEKTE